VIDAYYDVEELQRAGVPAAGSGTPHDGQTISDATQGAQRDQQTGHLSGV
jgi:hypothetical protein